MPRRTDIRNALATALDTVSGLGVHVARVLPLEDDDLPAALVYSGESSVAVYDVDGLPAQQEWRLRADLLVRGGAAGEAVADGLLDAMLAAVAASSALHDGQTDCQFDGTGEVDLDESLQRPALRLPVFFRVTYV